MLTRECQIDLPDTYPLTRLGNPEDLLFFDIETTGFSGERTTLYLIGCTYFSSGSWHLIQWFADTLKAEKEVLTTFFEFLKHYTTLIHFNGDGFDIPYLLKRCQAHHLPFDFSGITSIDIYKRIRPYKNLLGLDSLKQKSIEVFLGVSRQDVFSGGQLIEVYYEYLATKEDSLLHLLILHNEDDLKGMPFILPILSYADFLEHDFCLIGQEVTFQTDIFGTAYPRLTLTCQSPFHIPVPFDLPNSAASLEAHDNILTLNIELFDGTLKYFYPDYKNYYYLTYEDTAIHKSVAEYVDKDAKTKATAKNCYTKKEGRFLPQFEVLWEPRFQAENKDKTSYLLYDKSLLDNPDQFRTYLRHLIAYIKKGCK